MPQGNPAMVPNVAQQMPMNNVEPEQMDLS